MKRLLTLCACASLITTAQLLPIPTGKAELKTQKSSVERPLKTFKPTIQNHQIVSGNKQLDINPNGQLSLNCDGDTIARFHYFFTGKNAAGNSLWITAGTRGYNNAQSNLKKDGNTFTYEGFLDLDGVRWKQYRQRVELLPDGLVQVDCQWFPSPNPKTSLKGHSFWIIIPQPIAAGQTLSLDGKTATIRTQGKPRGGILSSSTVKQTRMVYFSDDKAKRFEVFGTRLQDLKTISQFDLADGVRTSLLECPKTRKLRFYIDLRQGLPPQNSNNLLADIDFKKLENLDLPDRSSRNLLRNPSFEQGFHEYFMFHPGYDYSPDKWGHDPFVLDRQHHIAGRRSLRIETLNVKDWDFRSLTKAANLSSSPVILEAGTYTCSFYAKGDTQGQILNVWCNRFRSGSYYAELPGAVASIHPSSQWKRYSFTFQITLSKPVSVHLNATSPTKSGFVWIDGLQLERGTVPTDFQTKAVEGELVTSAPDNFIAAGSPLKAQLNLTTTPNCKGTATVTVKNFYGEQVFRKELPFQATPQGTAIVNLPLDGKLGKGLFMVRTDYRTDRGQQCFDQHRFAVAEFLHNTHPLKRIFAKQYSGESDRHSLPRLLDRYRKVGIGTETHLGNMDKAVWDLYRSYGFQMQEGHVISVLYKNGRTKAGFGILKQIKNRSYAQVDDKDTILIRDFYLDAQGKITPEHLEKFKQAVKAKVTMYPWIDSWIPRHEFFAAFPVDWWSKTNNPDEAADMYAQYLKAFAEGVREANPKAKIIQDEPCNMTPTSRVLETERLLKACAKRGVKFDIIGFHPYRYSPENPDLDADTQTVFAMLKKVGYPDDTPLHWGEMMHWGPYNIPQWGTKSSSWTGAPITWCGHCTLSYDMGWTEKLSAAWRARAWLVALKYADRVMTAQSGNTNNFAIDYLLTPRASQMVSNTLGNLLGNASFRQDIRFAPYIRAYVFEDAQKRPVAAVWCHKQEVDSGRTDAPMAEADFGDSLEAVIDLMNQERSFQPGKLTFPAMSAPLFFRGKPHTLQAMVTALTNAVVVSGEGIAPIQVSANPVTPEQVRLTLKNFLSVPFQASLSGQSVTVPGNGEATVELPLPLPLITQSIRAISLPTTVTSGTGATYPFDLSFRGMLIRKLPENVTLNTLDLSQLPAVPLDNWYQNKKTPGYQASYRIGWNRQGLWFQVQVKDPHFSHLEYHVTDNRWDNDCLQIYVDALGDGRANQIRGYDDNDYDYAVFPNAKGTEAMVWRYRTADQQLGLGIHAPKDHTVATEFPVSFSRTADGYVYRLCIPANYLLPASLKKGTVMGLGIFAGNADDDRQKTYVKRRTSGLSNTTDGTDCFAKPHLWPAVLLWD